MSPSIAIWHLLSISISTRCVPFISFSFIFSAVFCVIIMITTIEHRMSREKASNYKQTKHTFKGYLCNVYHCRWIIYTEYTNERIWANRSASNSFYFKNNFLSLSLWAATILNRMLLAFASSDFVVVVVVFFLLVHSPLVSCKCVYVYNDVNLLQIMYAPFEHTICAILGCQRNGNVMKW